MINFKEYLTEQENKTTDEMVKNTIIHEASKEESLEDIVEKADPNTWTARIVNNIKYVIYSGKTLNITELKEEIENLYNSKGYSNYGFAKLDEHELIRYTRVKNIIMPQFKKGYDDELDPKHIANLLFINELKDFDWKPEEY